MKFQSLMALTLCAGLHAIAEPPAELVETATSEAVIYLDDGRLAPEEAEELLSYVDVTAIARFALGRYVHQVDEATFEVYRDALELYLVDQLQTHLGHLSGGDVVIKDTVPRGNDQAIVQTEVTASDGDVMNVNWRLRKDDGTWEVIDVEAMGLWLAIEQRAQFRAQLERNGGDVADLTRTIQQKAR